MVYFIDTDIIEGEECSCCGKVGNNSTVEKVRGSRVEWINIDAYGVRYQLKRPINLSENEVYETKEEADKHIQLTS